MIPAAQLSAVRQFFHKNFVKNVPCSFIFNML